LPSSAGDDYRQRKTFNKTIKTAVAVAYIVFIKSRMELLPLR